MNQSFLSILILAAIALFLVLRLRNVLGTRDGFEKSPQPEQQARPKLELVEDDADYDIVDNVPADSASAKGLAAIKTQDSSFSVAEFISGASQAYEMILMAFENDRLDDVDMLLSKEVEEAFDGALAARREQGLTVKSEFMGLRQAQITEVELDPKTREAEIKLRFVSELSTQVFDKDDMLIEGAADHVDTNKDIWTFARELDSDNPNWLLVATGA